MLTLGIETSCDETAASVVRDAKDILSNVVSSSVDLHRRFGGVVPEIACRAHVELISYVVDQALSEAGLRPPDLNLIAVTYGPGLVGALLVGISFAKVMSFALDIPLVGVNHLQAHIYACLMRKEGPKFPFVGLVISGGHTNLVWCRDVTKFELLGETIDDAAGEAFDKVAKILGLGYPGGPVIEKEAERGRPDRIDFPRSFLSANSLDFSFSGLKTAVLYYVRDSSVLSVEPVRPVNSIQRAKRANEQTEIADIAASFQESVIDVLIEKVLRACHLKKTKRIVVGGGVSANSRLRQRLMRDSKGEGLKVYFPPPPLCLDNAAMVAGLGYQIYNKGIASDLSLTAVPNLGIK